MFCITAVSYREELDFFLHIFQQLENTSDLPSPPPSFLYLIKLGTISYQPYIECIQQTGSDSHVYAQYIQEPTVSILYEAGVKIYSITISDVKNLGTV